MNRVNWVNFAIVAGLFLGSAGSVWILGNAEIARADAAYTAGEYAQASISYARAAQLLPFPALQRADLVEKIGYSAGLNGDYDRAIAYLQGQEGLTEKGWNMLAYAHVQKGDYRAATLAYESGLIAFPAAETLYAGVNNMYTLQKDWPSQRAALENQILHDTDNAQAHYRLGLLLALLAPNDALDELERAASLDPQLEPAVETMRTTLNIAATQTDEAQKLVTIGRGLGLVRYWTFAVEAFQRAIDADPGNAEAWAWLGEAEQQTGKDGSAALDQAIALDRDSPIVRALRGLQWSRLGDYERMRAEYSLAARAEPENPAWQAALGDAHLKLGDLAAAIGFYKRATELAPENASYWRLLAITCAENGVALEEVALPAALKAVELAPNDVMVLDTLGFTYFSSGRYANAEETLKAAIALDPGYWPASIHLAMNYLVQGNREEAFRLLTLVHNTDPGADGERAGQLLALHFP
jgi:tetratricopeptide (TPR) repeat protein